MEPKRIAIAVGFMLACLLAGGVGTIFTAPNIPAWYATLDKPVFSPPDWVFAPVWTTLYLMMGLAAYLVYEKGLDDKDGKLVRCALSIFMVQLALNILWSVLFFGLRSPIAGLICIIALWCAIAFTIKRFYRISKTAGLLLVPYILWVTFASLLNLSIWMLN